MYANQAQGSMAGGRDSIAPASPESEVGHAARTADEAVSVLEKLLGELQQRLGVVMTAEPPTASGQTKQAERAVSSQLANALLSHAHRIQGLQGVVHDTLRRQRLFRHRHAGRDGANMNTTHDDIRRRIE